MDTKNLKAYAPQARRDFIAAVTKRAAQFGLYEDRIADVTIEGSSAIIEGRVFTRKQALQRGQLAKRINELGFSQFINEAAFTWVNRLTAIRYMEVNGYLEHGFRILSMPPKNDAGGNEVTAKFGQGFEILAHAADVAEHLELDKSSIVKMLLAGDKEEELYREILLGECHQLSKVMPFMFEKLNDATELLLPDNLTKTDSILKELVDRIPETDWQDIEVIGWLYQFYIAEHKDSVMGKVVKKEDIPAATQLFTPNWIVKYLVQNSVGRQWLATYPDSEIKEKMEFYIAPAEQSDDVIDQLKAITPTSIDPETIKVIDPACGSGHILVEVYEVLREIYLERGYRLREIPELILTKNIYGLDIDDRAAQMAAFAVLMKAREDDRRIFERIASNDIKLNIHSLQSTEHLDIIQLWADLDLEDKHQTGSMSGLFDQEFEEPTQSLDSGSGEYDVYLDLLRYLKTQFIEAKNLGSLIDVNSEYLEKLIKLNEKLLDKINAKDTLSTPAAEKLLPIVEQAILLSNKYDVVVANPPYMGSKGMNSTLKAFAKKQYPNSKSDLFAIFMERTFNLLTETGYNAQVNMQSWMFLSSYEKMRESLLDTKTFLTMAHLGARAFNQISGEIVQTTAWILNNNFTSGYNSTFLRLIDGKSEQEKREMLIGVNQKLKNKDCTYLFDAKPDEFNKIPGSPIAYWMNDKAVNVFKKGTSLGELASPRKGNSTSDNNRFLRYWAEVDIRKLGIDLEFFDNKYRWIPYNKGGGFRKWYGFNEFVIDWKDQGAEIRGIPSSVIANEQFFFKPGLTWSTITSSYFSIRNFGNGYIFDNGGCCIFGDDYDKNYVCGLLNSKVFPLVLGEINPTLNFQSGDVAKFPVISNSNPQITEKIGTLVNRAIELSKDDWNSYERSWDFKKHSLLNFSANGRDVILSESYEHFLFNQNSTVNEMIDIEEDLNNIFINTYDVDTSSEVPLRQLTITANPNYRYPGLDCSEIKSRVKSDTFGELISYSIGCMLGRFSLDVNGLVYAHYDNKKFKQLVLDGVYQTYHADDDGIVPLASEAWLFDDDATARFRDFVKTVWGAENLQENLDFVAESLCLNAIKPKNGENSTETIRRYLSTQFYKDHLKTYKKRPIYWLFSSGKEKAFECLVYLHRYNEGTLSRMRTEYVTPLMGKFESQTSILRDERDTATSSEQRRIDKELKSIEKKQAELNTFDEELKHISEMKISLDLDDGVKVNYGKFGNLLANVKDIHGKKPEVVK